MYNYIAEKKNYSNPDIGSYESYRIYVTNSFGRKITSVEDISDELDFVNCIINLLYKLSIKPSLLTDLVSELLDNPNSVFLKI